MISIADDSRDSMIRHLVCLKFKEETSKAKIRMIEREFTLLEKRIAGIVSIEWGINDSPEGLNKEFTHCFLITFESEAARTSYLPHPAHQEFVSMLQPLLQDVFVFDYTL